MFNLVHNSSRLTGCVNTLIVLSIVITLIASSNAGLNDQVKALGADSSEDLSEDFVDSPLSSTAGTRAGTVIFNDGGVHTLASGSYSDIIVYNGSTLKINNADIVVGGSFKVTDSLSNLEITGSTISTEYGFFMAYCKNLTISDSSIDVINKSSTFADGSESNIWMKSEDALTIKNSDIFSTGKKGLPGGRGGDGRILIESAKGITIVGKKDNGTRGIGGQGGDEEARRSGSRSGRQGGWGYVTLKANGDVNIQDSIVLAQGGMGGSPRGAGGKSYFDITTNNKAVSILRSDAGARGGLGGDYDPIYAGLGYITTESKTFGVDVPNFLDTESGSLSTIWGWSIQIDAANDCKIYNAEITSYKDVSNRLHPADDKTTIQVFYWLDVLVKDSNGDILVGATVRILNDAGGEIAKSQTDSSGTAKFPPIEGRTSTKTDETGSNIFIVEGTFLDVTNQIIDIKIIESYTLDLQITLLSINILQVNGITPSEGMVVGCAVVITGTAVPPPTISSNIESVTVTVDGQLITPGPEDTSGAGTWSSWKLTWNSLTVDETLHNLVFTVTLNTIVDSAMLNLTVDQKSCNHAPVITDLLYPPDKVGIRDSEATPSILISGFAFDEDFQSSLTEGTHVKQVIIVIVNSTGAEVLNYVILSDFMNYNELTGKWSWNYEWSSRVTTVEGDRAYPNDEYTISVYANDGVYDSLPWGWKNATIDLYHEVIPTAIISEVNDIPVVGHVEEILVSTNKETVEVSFNANSSFDLDGTIDEMEFHWNFGDGNPADWSDSDKITHEFKVKTDQKSTTYDIVLTVRDKDMLNSLNVSENRVTIKINFEPPPEPMKGPFNSLFSIDLKSDSMYFMFIGIIIALNALGAAGILINNRRIARGRAAQRALMDQQRRELAAEVAKERKESGYGDFTDEYSVVTEKTDAKPAAAPTPAAPTPAAPTPAAPTPVAPTPAAPTPAAPAPAAPAPVAPAPVAPAPAAPAPAPPAPAAPAPAPPAPAPPAPAPPAPAAPAPAPPAPAAPAPAPAQMVACPTCGAQIGVGTTPCSGCGTNLNWS